VFWRAFLAGLKKRGLGGVRLVIFDQHAGLVAALKRSFQGTAHQRCRVHYPDLRILRMWPLDPLAVSEFLLLGRHNQRLSSQVSRLSAQPGGGLVRDHRAPGDPPRHLRLRQRPQRQDPRLHRRLERRCHPFVWTKTANDILKRPTVSQLQKRSTRSFRA
jgi:hypothetical protein